MLVGQDDALVPAMESHASDQRFADPRAGAVGRGKGLFEIIQGRFRGTPQDAFAEPGLIQIAGAGVFVCGFRVAGLFLAEFDADEIVGRELQILLAHVRGDLVVRLGQDVVRLDPFSVVQYSSKRLDICHGMYLLLRADTRRSRP